MGRHPCLEEDDILQCVTSYHESFHSIQDVATGFGCLVNEFMRLRDEYAIEDLQQIIKNGHTSFPLAIRTKPTDGHYIYRAVNEALQQYSQTQNTVDVLLTGCDKKHGMGSLDILEGAAAFFSEIYRRWHIYMENLNPPAEFANIYNFNAIFKMVNKLPRRYNSALNYYQNHLVRHWADASDVDLCNLFLLICDLSLQVPSPEIISKNLDTKKSEKARISIFEQYLAGNRFISIVDYIARNKLFFNRVPMERYKATWIFSDGPTINPDAYRQILHSKLKKAEILEEKFNLYSYDKDDDFNLYIDKLCNGLRYETVDEICESWIKFFQEQIQIAPLEEVLKLRLEYMKLRKSRKCFLSSYPNIRKILLERKYPTYFRTKLGNRVVCLLMDKDKPDPIRSAIILKMFMRNITYQLLFSGVRMCPFSNKTIYPCSEEKPECSNTIDCRDKTFSKCEFGKMFEMILGIPLSKIKNMPQKMIIERRKGIRSIFRC